LDELELVLVTFAEVLEELELVLPPVVEDDEDDEAVPAVNCTSSTHTSGTVSPDSPSIATPVIKVPAGILNWDMGMDSNDQVFAEGLTGKSTGDPVGAGLPELS